MKSHRIIEKPVSKQEILDLLLSNYNAMALIRDDEDVELKIDLPDFIPLKIMIKRKEVTGSITTKL